MPTWRQTGIDTGKLKGLEEYFTRSDDYLTKTSNQMREHLETKTRSTVLAFEEFFTQLNRTDWKKLQLAIDLVETDSVYNDEAILLSTRLLREEFNKFVRKIRRGGKEVAHKDFSVFAGNMLTCYILTEKIVEDAQKAGKTRTSIPTRTGGNTRKNVTRSIKNLQEIGERFRKLYIIATAIAELPKSEVTATTSIGLMREALNRYFSQTNQTTHIIKKNKNVDVLAGIAEQKLELETQTKLEKSTENMLGVLGTSVKQASLGSDPLADQYRNEMGPLFIDFQQNFLNITGSKPTGKEILKQSFDIVQGKRPKKYKSKTTKKRKTKTKFSNPIEGNLVKAATAAMAAKAIKPLKPAKVRTGGKKAEVDQQELTKLKRLINRRLPAEVRRNMGPPALTNRTGTFSNSVKLLDLKQGPKTIIGNYTYMRTGGGSPPRSGQPGVYETFERMGAYADRWPHTYNPKPLIAKSIRKLAKKHTEQKFTLRRV